MIVGKIVGTTTTKEFDFIVEGKVKKFDYLQVINEDSNYYLCQVIELYRDKEKTLAHAVVIGRYENNTIIQPLEPFKPETEVLLASDDFIKNTLQLDFNGLFIGFLSEKNIPIYLNPTTLITKHLAILAKTGAGKSYALGVILEELLKKNVPIVIIDPHGEYSSLREPNYEEESKLMQFNLKPISFSDKVVEFGDPTINKNVVPLKIKEDFSPEDFVNLFPAKLTSSQKILLYNAIKSLDEISLDNLIYFLESDSNTTSAKIGLISQLKYIKSLNIFDPLGVNYHEFVKLGRASIINLKGYSQEVQTLIVYKILNDLFYLRKINEIPPFFCVIEEAHNFCPERNFGEVKSSQIIRTIASEGRKFGLGLAIVSQRPSRIDKNVLSQCNTNIVLKVTNPNDLRAISHSLEGLTSESEKEIKNLPVGTAIITGIVDVPLFVRIRPRQTKHGGISIKFIKSEETRKKKIPVILPHIKKSDLELILNKPLTQILVPALFVTLKKENKVANVLFDLVKGFIIKDLDKRKYLKSITDDLTAMECFYDLTYVDKMNVDKILNKAVDPEKIINLLKKNFNVISYKECFFLLYAPNQ